MRPMTIKEAAMVMYEFAKGKYYQSGKAYYARKTSGISVEEDWSVKAYVYYLSDIVGCRTPEPCVDIEIVVGDFTFGCTVDEFGEFSQWVVKNDGIDFPWDSVILTALLDLLDTSVIRDMGSYFLSCKVPSYDEEWTNDEITEYILNELAHDQYIEVDEEVYPYYGDLERFAIDHFEDPKYLEDLEYTIMTREEAARYLANHLLLDIG